MRIKKLEKGKKFYTYNCTRCYSTIDAWEYEKNGGLCWKCAGNYDPN